MSILSRFFAATEADVVALIGAIKKDAVIVAHDIDRALTWIAKQTPTIVSDLQTATKLVAEVGAVSNPQIAAAVTAANIAVAALNAFASAKTSGQSDVSAVVQGYVAVKQANAAVNAAAAAAASK